MDITQILKTASLLVSGAIGTYGATELVKKLKKIKLDKKVVRGIAGVFSVLAMVLVGIANGNVQPANIQDLVIKLLEVGLLWYGSHTAHKLTK